MSSSVSTVCSSPLSTLLAGYTDAPFDSNPIITGLSLDSRTVSYDDCFFALQGSQGHGLRYLSDAIARGAVAVVTDDSKIGYAHSGGVPVIVVPSLHEKIGEIAARFYAYPSEQLTVIAVTGTNGKTTVAHLCAQALCGLGRACGYIGTLGAGPLESLTALGLTTPDSIALQREYKRLLDADFHAVALEASSHALSQSRLVGTAIDIATFTGFGYDHLDYHTTLEAYAEAKRKLFQHRGLQHAVINIDDEVGRQIRADLAPSVTAWECSLCGVVSPDALRFVHARATEYRANGTHIEIATHLGSVVVDSELVGDFNAHNLLLVLAVLLTQDIPLATAAIALSKLKPVMGRLEVFGGTADYPTVYVDYAHSPDSLERVLKVLRGFAPARVLTVFGCGGNRDRSKRPLMGAIAQRLSDHVYLTSDNPRDENPISIIEEILAGFEFPPNATIIEDRTSAISAALSAASPRDIVLIAGKGHETGQVVGGRTISLSDQQIVTRWLESQP